MSLNFANRMLMKIKNGTKKSKCLSYHFMMENSMIHQCGSGLYALLPIGQRVVDKLQRIIECHLVNSGAQKLDMPLIIGEKVFNSCGRWDKFGSELFRLADRSDERYCLQPTAEELVTQIVRDSIGEPRKGSLPLLVFQTTQKYRDEQRPRYGLLRSRQFLMNDLYSFDGDENDAQNTYNRITQLYWTLFKDVLKLKHVYRIAADASLMGGRVSHEFHLPSESSESRILNCKNCGFSKESPPFESDSKDASVGACENCDEAYKMLGSIEVAHTFQLGTKYSRTLRAMTHENRPYFMGCFGVGVTRLLAACIDVSSISTQAMRLPYAIVPFKLAVVLPKRADSDPRWSFIWNVLRDLEKLPNLSNEILVDDRCERSVGKRLDDLNRLGVPHIVICNSMKTDDSCAVPSLEYFRALIGEETLQAQLRLSHADLLRLARSL